MRPQLISKLRTAPCTTAARNRIVNPYAVQAEALTKRPTGSYSPGSTSNEGSA